MHWLVYIGAIWFTIYVTSILIAFVVNVLLPIPPVAAATSGLLGALIGVFYYLFKHADHPVQDAIDRVGRPGRPSAGLGDVVGEEDFGGIIEELREGDEASEDSEDRPATVPEGE